MGNYQSYFKKSTEGWKPRIEKLKEKPWRENMENITEIYNEIQTNIVMLETLIESEYWTNEAEPNDEQFYQMEDQTLNLLAFLRPIVNVFVPITKIMEKEDETKRMLRYERLQMKEKLQYIHSLLINRNEFQIAYETDERTIITYFIKPSYDCDFVNLFNVFNLSNAISISQSGDYSTEEQRQTIQTLQKENKELKQQIELLQHFSNSKEEDIRKDEINQEMVIEINKLRHEIEEMKRREKKTDILLQRYRSKEQEQIRIITEEIKKNYNYIKKYEIKESNGIMIEEFSVSSKIFSQSEIILPIVRKREFDEELEVK